LGRSQAHRHISAAAVLKNLSATPGMPVPECEAQVRPLIGLPAQHAQTAWLNALSMSHQDYVPARLVKRAAQQALRAEQPAAVIKSNAPSQQRYRNRQSVRTAFAELLTMLLGNAPRDAVIAKVQEVQRLLEPMLNPKKNKA
jgi:hypothetical protein